MCPLAKKTKDGNNCDTLLASSASDGESQLNPATDKAKSAKKTVVHVEKDTAKLKSAPENPVTAAADSPGKVSNNGDVPGTIDVPDEVEGKADAISDSDEAKVKVKKALQKEQKKAQLKKKHDNVCKLDKPFNFANRTTVQLQIDELHPYGRNPKKIFSLLQVAKRLFNRLGRLRHIWHNTNSLRKNPSLCFLFEDWEECVVAPWDGELFCAMS